MSSIIIQTPTQLAEINNLSARLAIAKTIRSTQIGVINDLKMRRVHEYTILLSSRDGLDQQTREVQFVDSINNQRDGSYRFEGTNETESQRSRAMQEWTDLGIQLQRAFEGLRVRDREIAELERILVAWKSM